MLGQTIVETFVVIFTTLHKNNLEVVRRKKTGNAKLNTPLFTEENGKVTFVKSHVDKMATFFGRGAPFTILHSSMAIKL